MNIQNVTHNETEISHLQEQSSDAGYYREELENRLHKLSHTAGQILISLAVDLYMITKSLGRNSQTEPR